MSTTDPMTTPQQPVSSEEVGLTQERLMERLHYNPKTGEFTWMATHRAGSRAGSPNNLGYIQIDVDGRKYKAHRLAFLYMTTNWPAHGIDHINGKPDDNRWENLREATHGQNMRNMKVPSTNKSGFRGVHRHSQMDKWEAGIRAHGRKHYLGIFDVAEDAARAYDAAAERLHGEFARTNVAIGLLPPLQQQETD